MARQPRRPDARASASQDAAAPGEPRAADRDATPAAGASDLPRNDGLVLAVLREAGAPLTAYAILDRLRGQGLRAPAQVYRSLERLRGQGRVHRLESLNAFMACRHLGCEAHEPLVFMICGQCGCAEELVDPAVADGLAQLAQRHRFTVAHAAVEMRGLCARCGRQGAGATTRRTS